MSERIRVLLIEDDPADVDLTREMLREGKVMLDLQVMQDGESAMRFLRRVGPYAESSRPDLILLDLNLPGKDGREVLKEIKGDPELKAIPVVIMTSSDADADILKTYTVGANCYVTKPVNLEQFARLIREIEDFWFTVIKLPPRSSS